MRKKLALVMAGLLALSAVGCGSKTKTETKTEAQSTASGQEAETDESKMEALVEAAKAEGELIVYGSCEDDYLAAACENFQEKYGIKVSYQRLSTGEVQSKIEEEKGNPSGDVWFGGTTDPYNVSAQEGLLESYEAINASHLTNEAYRDPDGYWYGIYKGILGFMVNRDELARMGLQEPRDWK